MGGFDVDQLVEGKIAGFNLWSHAMDVQELNAISCDDVGNVVQFSDLQPVFQSFSDLTTMSYTEYETFYCSKYR